MTQGFYRQLGVSPEADTEEIRTAYRRLVAQLLKRRKGLVEQGGDTSALDLARVQADEAWSVLSDPGRRRKYDAMVALGDGVQDADALWGSAMGALASPAVAAAAELLDRTTKLQVGRLPEAPGSKAPRPAPTPPPPDPPTEPTESMAPPLSVPTPSIAPPEKPPVPLPTPALVMPRTIVGSSVSGEDIARLVDSLGYTGALLRAVREARGIALADLADVTRISERYLEALEQDDHASLPSATFVRGYVREVARVLQLDDDAVTRGYMAHLPG